MMSYGAYVICLLPLEIQNTVDCQLNVVTRTYVSHNKQWQY